MKLTYKCRQAEVLHCTLDFDAEIISVVNPTPYTLLIRTGGTFPPSGIETADLIVAPSSGATYPVSGRIFGMVLGFPSLSEVPAGMPNVAQVMFITGETAPTMGSFALTQATVTVANPVDTVTVANPVTSVGITGTVPVSGAVTTTPAAGSTQAVSGTVGVAGTVPVSGNVGVPAGVSVNNNVPVTNVPGELVNVSARLPGEAYMGRLNDDRVGSGVTQWSVLYGNNPNPEQFRALGISNIGPGVDRLIIKERDTGTTIATFRPREQPEMSVYIFPFAASVNSGVDLIFSWNSASGVTGAGFYWFRHVPPWGQNQRGIMAVQLVIPHLPIITARFENFIPAGQAEQTAWTLFMGGTENRYTLQHLGMTLPPTTSIGSAYIQVYLLDGSGNVVGPIAMVEGETTRQNTYWIGTSLEIPPNYRIRCNTRNADTVGRYSRAFAYVTQQRIYHV